MSGMISATSWTTVLENRGLFRPRCGRLGRCRRCARSRRASTATTSASSSRSTIASSIDRSSATTIACSSSHRRVHSRSSRNASPRRAEPTSAGVSRPAAAHRRGVGCRRRPEPTNRRDHEDPHLGRGRGRATIVLSSLPQTSPRTIVIEADRSPAYGRIRAVAAAIGTHGHVTFVLRPR
jgi:hypothetical protein